MPFKLLSLQNYPEVTISKFPITLPEMNLWLTEMNELLAQYQDFVLIYPTFDPLYFDQAEPQSLKAARKMALAWFQENRVLLKIKCRGIILPIKEDDSDLPIIEIHRDELESFYRIPTEILYHPKDLTTLSSALLYDFWDMPTAGIHKISS